MSEISVEDIEGTVRTDFRRANGAPMVMIDGKNERFSRPSGWGKELDDENALVNWKINKAIKGVAGDKALQARAVSLSDDDKTELASLREAAIGAGRGAEAADIGTALHKMSERWEQEPDFDPGPPYTSKLEVYEKALNEMGLTSTHFEVQMVNVEYRAAGTADRIYVNEHQLIAPDGSIIEPGTNLIGDLKTGKSLDFSLPGYTIQMAIYAQGRFYDVEADDFIETPEINQDWGIIVHLDAREGKDHCQLIWCDLAQGNQGAYLVHEVRSWRKFWRGHKLVELHLPEPAPAPKPISALETIREALPGTRELTDDEQKRLIVLRIQTISQNEKALNKVTQNWPDDCPPPKQLETQEQIGLVTALLDDIEAEFGFPFPETELPE